MLLVLWLLLPQALATWKKQGGLKGCYMGPQDCLCSGSENKRSITGSAHRVEDLRLIYQNCSRIFGNIEITHLTVDKNDTLDFFDDIEEVKGYIYIYKTVNLTSLSFKKLQIIWGDKLLDGFSFSVENSPQLEVISMPNLRTIKNGNVGVAVSNRLCHIKEKVDFGELLDFEEKERLQLSYYNKTICDFRRKPQCHKSCGNNCWGPTENDCQSTYRRSCPEQCTHRMCYDGKSKYASNGETSLNTSLISMNGPQTSLCCDSQCEAGCFGSGPNQCHACKNFVQCDGPSRSDCKCVEQCTPRVKYDPKKGMSVPNPDGFYSHDGRYCEKECPPERLIQNDICVEHCSPGWYYDVESDDRQCRKCDGECPKVCKFEKELNALTIQELQNCTEIEGYIRLMASAFRDHFYFDPENKVPRALVRGMTPADLDILRTVRIVSEYVYIAAESAPIASLSFLENLEIIEGRSGLNQNKQTLAISLNDNLAHLGLRKLREIKKGDVVISRNVDLCYVDSIVWKDIVKGTNSTFNINSNRLAADCREDNKVCSNMCDETAGCWGGSSYDCRRCKEWRQNGQCVESCSKRGFYANATSRECIRCYPECDTCKGPGEEDCLTCRFFKLYVKNRHYRFDEEDDDDVVETKKESFLIKEHDDDTTSDYMTTLPQSEQVGQRKDLRCFTQCPSKQYYIDGDECKKCHRSCYDHGCTGPSNDLGVGGCNNCTYAQVELDGGTENVLRCLYNPKRAQAPDVCINNDLLDHFVAASSVDGVKEWVCKPCDSECSTCTSFGPSRLINKCVCKNHLMFLEHKPPGSIGPSTTNYDERCIANCGKNMFRQRSEEAGIAGYCRMCSYLCDRTVNEAVCTGPTESDCTRCHKEAYVVIDGGNKTCVKECPSGLFPYSRDNTCYEVDYEQRLRIRNTGLWLAGIIFIILVIIIGYYLIRRQRRLKRELDLEKVANAPELPELIPMDFSRTKPNMERVHLIPQQALTKSTRQLGSGAFGIVYAGFWTPQSKDIKVPVAIKVVRDPSGRAQTEMLEEATKMTMLRHEHLLRIVGICLSGEDLQLVTLLRPLGNLLKFLQTHKVNIGGKEILSYSYQIASGMKYLSDQRVVHRDLAARNVLVKNSRHVEITDFGLARLIDYGSDSVQVGEGKVALKWLALEALEKQVYNTATDVWAFGVTVWEILTYGESPYPGMTPMAIKDYLHSGQRLEQPNNCSTDLYETMLKCWMEKPDSRPTFKVLKDLFYGYLRAPRLFVMERNDESAFNLDGINDKNQRDILAEILDDTDFEDPQNYGDSEPNTPGFISHSDSFNAMAVRRMDSLSTRYAADPMGGRQEFGMNDDNYLVPNSQSADVGATMYTPVVVDASGKSSLVESNEYYNEVKPGAEYINETEIMKKKRNSNDERLAMIEEDEGIEKESCL